MRNIFSKLGAYLSMGMYLSPGHLISNFWYVLHKMLPNNVSDWLNCLSCFSEFQGLQQLLALER